MTLEFDGSWYCATCHEKLDEHQIFELARVAVAGRQEIWVLHSVSQRVVGRMVDAGNDYWVVRVHDLTPMLIQDRDVAVQACVLVGSLDAGIGQRLRDHMRLDHDRNVDAVWETIGGTATQLIAVLQELDEVDYERGDYDAAATVAATIYKATL
jgi:hypothetical protein